MTQADLTGKTAFVTGANSGIGKYTAKALAEMGAKVVITGRNEDSLKDAQTWIKTETGNDDPFCALK